MSDTSSTDQAHGRQTTDPTQARTRPYCVGLTGGVASGKTAVSDALAKLGAPVVDTDVIAREVLAPGSEGLSEVRAHFGESVFHADGSLDRRALRTRIFSNALERRALESITHPRIRERVKACVNAYVSTAPYVVVVIPLLSEGNRYPFLDHIVVVDVSPDVQQERLQARDGITEQLAQAMIEAQATRAERLRLADSVISNDQGLDELMVKVEHLHKQLLTLSANGP